MPKLLNLKHFPQEAEAGCLPACAQMVLAYLGISHSQTSLAEMLATHPQMGARFSNIVHLQSNLIDVVLQEARALDDLSHWLNQDLPVIAFIERSELPYSADNVSQHAVVVVGLDQDNIYLLDPAAQSSVITVTHGDFLLAWDEMKLAYAVISKKQ